MSTESSDDLPLNARGLSPTPSGSRSPVPEWLSAHKVCAVPIELSSSQEDDADDDADDSSDAAPKKPVRGRAKAGGVTASNGKKTAAKGAAVGSAAKATAAAAAAGEQDDGLADGAAQDGDGDVKAAKKKPKSVKKAPGLLAGVAGNSGTLDQVIGKELPLVMLPEKLPRNKALVELEARPDGATDLAGDAGAVGRFLVATNAAGKEEVSIDLKGVVYSAAVVPCATTLCVVNIGASEAKVECLLRSFVQLREQPGFAADDTGGADLFADDEDNYQLGATPDAAAEKKAAGKKAKAAAAKAKGGTLKARGGVSKAGAGKPRAKGPAKPRKPAARKPAKAKS